MKPDLDGTDPTGASWSLRDFATLDLAIAIASTLTVALIAMAMIFSLARGTANVSDTATAGIYEEASLSAATTARNGVVHAHLVAGAHAAGIATEDDVSVTLQQVEDASAELSRRLELVTEDVVGRRVAAQISSDAAAFTESLEAVVEYVRSNDLDASAATIDDELVPTYDALAGGLRSQRDRALTQIALARNDSGRLADAARFLVALLLPVGLLFAYRARARREKQRLTEKAEEATIYQATHDSLTGLINRTLLKDRLDVALANAARSEEKVAVVFLDLDRFKLVNDSAGHSVGDELLLHVADRVLTLVREGDSVARVGGDEFVLLMPRMTDTREILRAAQRVVDGVRETWRVAAREFTITASAGIAVYPDHGADAESLLRNADTAMYRAKDAGRDTFRLFSPNMNHEIEERVSLERNLRNAIKTGQFTLHYQPQVRRGGQIVGVEALIRWNHPDRGLVEPDEFIYVAEEMGLIFPIGEWALETACRQLVEWRGRGVGTGVRMSVNVSARQFQDPMFVDKVKATLNEAGLAARSLELELTESAAMRDVVHSIRTLKALNRLGVRASIDDFGTGYSSLAYLRQFPIDTVKIDRSFIENIADSPDSASIVTAIITLAETLGMTTIAEGVETEEQLALLQASSCPVYQGFHFGAPLPAAEIEQVLARAELPGGFDEATTTVRVGGPDVD